MEPITSDLEFAVSYGEIPVCFSQGRPLGGNGLSDLTEAPLNRIQRGIGLLHRLLSMGQSHAIVELFLLLGRPSRLRRVGQRGVQGDIGVFEGL
ncbi:MAG: hypothetical protein MK041_03155 [Aquabacterium sp.]|nr:hypothetical protein [Aquabacterium sp.]